LPHNGIQFLPWAHKKAFQNNRTSFRLDIARNFEGNSTNWPQKKCGQGASDPRKRFKVMMRNIIKYQSFYCYTLKIMTINFTWCLDSDFSLFLGCWFQ